MEKTTNNNWTSTLVLIHLQELMKSNDARYVELFSSSEKAVTTAFIASEKATAAAFAASEKAIRDALAAQEKSTQAAFVAAEKAVALAEANAERWRQDAQEWRTRMTDREKDFAKTSEVSSLKERIDRGDGNTGGMKSMWGWIVSGIMLIITLYETFRH